MARTMQIDGIEQVSELLTKLQDKAQEVAARALYKGAGAMKDALNNSVNSIQNEKFHYAACAGTYRLPSPEQVDAIRQKVGVAKFDKNGSEITTAIGLNGSGYVTIAGRQRPVIAIARSINSGTSFMRKQPFFRKAASSAKGAASAAVVAQAQRLFDEIKR